MKLIVTCGPSHEPIDGARRLTNMSTGRLGAALADALAEAGHEVICLRGEGSTHAGPARAARVLPFSTNDDLAARLEELSRNEVIDGVFHAAALCDYRVASAQNASGESVRSAKIATRDGRLHLVLEPARKVLPLLRGWFPSARLVGWKYELAGSGEEAFAKAWRQVREGGVDACVLNGAAYGPGFAFCRADGSVIPCADTPALCRLLRDWVERPRPTFADSPAPAAVSPSAGREVVPVLWV